MRHVPALASAAFVAALATAHADEPIRILVNHLGYEAGGTKHAVIQGSAADHVSACAVEDARSGQEALALVPQRVGPVAKWKDWRFSTVDFDGVTVEGAYVIACQTGRGMVRSLPFAIRKDLLERNTLSNVLYYFKGQRSSGAVDQADRRLSFEGNRPGTRDLHGGWFDATGDYGKHLSHLSFLLDLLQPPADPTRRLEPGPNLQARRG